LLESRKGMGRRLVPVRRSLTIYILRLDLYALVNCLICVVQMLTLKREKFHKTNYRRKILLTEKNREHRFKRFSTSANSFTHNAQ